MQALAPFVTGIVVAVVSAIITVRLALHRFYSEKWWEKKLLTYTSVIEALFHMQNSVQAQLDSYIHSHPLSQERQDELATRARDGHDEIARAAAVGTFLISPNASQCLLKCQEKLDEAETANNFIDYANARLDAVTKCLASIRELAKKDLGVK